MDFSISRILYQGRHYQKERIMALDILDAALRHAHPGQALRRKISLSGSILEADGKHFDLDETGNIIVTGAGKAGLSMALALEDLLGDRIAGGAVTVPHGIKGSARRITIQRAGHPLPDRYSVDGASEIAALLKKTDAGDLVLCPISGGASALLALPEEGISLDDMIVTTDLLLRAGAPIEEINAVRKHICRMKGGKMARHAWPSTVVSLILSDVVGNRLDIIASGLTAPDSSTFADAVEVIAGRGLTGEMPHSVMAHLEAGRQGRFPENPGPGNPIFTKVHNILLGGNEMAAEAALQRARELSFNTLLLTTSLEGEASGAGHSMASMAYEIAFHGKPLRPPACIIAAGETTVNVRGSGMGGRNQELALAAAIDLQKIRGAVLVSSSTDGIDGPTDASGAIVDSETIERAQGLDPHTFLQNNDSYHFLEKTGDLMKTGATGTNVNDLIILCVF